MLFKLSMKAANTDCVTQLGGHVYLDFVSSAYLKKYSDMPKISRTAYKRFDFKYVAYKILEVFKIGALIYL